MTVEDTNPPPAASEAATTATHPWLHPLDADQVRLATVAARLVAVQAGPGAGKTRTLVARFAQLVAQGQDPFRIAVVTYTRRAALEFRARLSEAAARHAPHLPGAPAMHALAEALRAHDGAGPVAIDAPPRAVVGTLHELASRIVRATPHVVGLPARPRTIEPDETDARIARALADTRGRAPGRDGPQFDQHDVWKVKQQLSGMKRTGRLSGHPATVLPDVPAPTSRPEYDAAVEHYLAACRADGVVDYDDLVLLAWRILATDPVAGAAWSLRFDHLFIDEVQDIDPLLAHMVATLARDGAAVAVGDADQSIYEWRGAIGQMNAIPILEQTLGPATWIPLRHDYRLTRSVQDAAQQLRAHLAHPARTEVARTERRGYGPPQIDLYTTPEEERDALAQRIREILASEVARPDAGDGQTHASSWRDCMVLVRTGAEAQHLAQALARHEVPVRIHQRARFADATRALLAWLGAAAHPSDPAVEAAFAQLKPPVHPPALDPVRHPRLSLAERFDDPETVAEARLTRRARAAVQAWQIIRSVDPSEPVVLLHAIETTLKLPHRATTDGAHSEREYTRVRDAARSIAAQSADACALHAALSATPDEDDAPKEDRVTVSTMHGAKGLEARHVWTPHWIEGAFPHRARTGRSLEEERRLAFTALTRARRTFAASASLIDAKQIPVKVSRFAVEARLVEIRRC